MVRGSVWLVSCLRTACCTEPRVATTCMCRTAHVGGNTVSTCIGCMICGCCLVRQMDVEQRASECIPAQHGAQESVGLAHATLGELWVSGWVN
jgi:hypothetical protein